MMENQQEFDRGVRQGLANAQWIVELAARDGRDPVEAIRAALVKASRAHLDESSSSADRRHHREPSQGPEGARELRNSIAALSYLPSDVPTCEASYLRGLRRTLFRDPPFGEMCSRDADVMNAHEGDYSAGMGDGERLRDMIAEGRR